MKVGEITKVKWYKFKGDDHFYSAHMAFAERGGEGIILFSDEATWPSQVAEENGLEYAFMRNAQDDEVNNYLRTCDRTVVEVIEV